MQNGFQLNTYFNKRNQIVQLIRSLTIQFLLLSTDTQPKKKVKLIVKGKYPYNLNRYISE